MRSRRLDPWTGWPPNQPGWTPPGPGPFPTGRPGAWRVWAVLLVLLLGVFGPAGAAAIVRDAARATAHLRPGLHSELTPSRRPPGGAGARACPVQGPVRLATGGAFGACRDGCARRHHGIDLFARLGTPLVAVADGRIVKASPRDRGLGGISLTLQARDGTRFYYAHNQHNLVGLGASVRRSQPIAAVGRTGNAAATPAHLHFEFRPPGRGPIDPGPSIRRWCR